MRSASIASTILLLLTLVCYAQSGERTHGPGRITGTVLNENGRPIDHAFVCVSSSGSSHTECSVFTDPNGQFEIQHLPLGTSSVFATKEEDGYSAHSQAPGQKITLTSQEPSANVTVRLAPKAGTLIGSVKDSLTGKPVDKISVIYVAENGQGSGSAGVYAGEFRVNLPTTSAYLVFVSAPGYRTWFYTDPSDQSRVSLRLASGEQKSVDVELVPEPKAADKP
jgi:hypothetical protein